jgi:hypothetical protein
MSSWLELNGLAPAHAYGERRSTVARGRHSGTANGTTAGVEQFGIQDPGRSRAGRRELTVGDGSVCRGSRRMLTSECSRPPRQPGVQDCLRWKLDSIREFVGPGGQLMLEFTRLAPTSLQKQGLASSLTVS